jgi:hypothetical protein
MSEETGKERGMVDPTVQARGVDCYRQNHGQQNLFLADEKAGWFSLARVSESGSQLIVPDIWAMPEDGPSHGCALPRKKVGHGRLARADARPVEDAGIISENFCSYLCVRAF